MFTVLTDLRHAWRQSRHAPLATVLILVALGLAIGANTLVFSLADALLMRPLGVRDPGQLVRVGTSTGDEPYGITSWPDYVDLRDEVKGLDGLAATGWTLVGLSGQDATERLVGEMVTWNYWSVLGVQPRPGRAFLPQEDRRGAAAPVVILSHALWRDRFGGDPAMIDSTISLSGVPYTVVGIAPPGFRGLSTIVRTDVWVPAMMVGKAYTWHVNLDGRRDPWLNLVGRLEPGATMEGVQTSLNAVAARLQQAYPRDNEGKRFTAVELERTRVVPSQTTDRTARGMALLQAVTVLVLLIACFNIANVFMARANARGHEIALRFAMGASRGRIVRQLLTEGFLVAVVAAALGFLAGRWCAAALWSLQPNLELPLNANFGVDGRVVVFITGIAVLTALVFSLTPALYAARPEELSALRNRPRGGAGGSFVQRALVAGQIALAVVVLLTAGVFLRSLRATTAMDPGFDLRQGFITMINLGFIRYEEEDATALLDQLKSRVETVKGVHLASFSTSVPLGAGGGRHDVRIPGYEPAPGEWMVFRRNMIDGDYLRTMGMRVAAGRGIDGRDRRDTEPVAVVNETMARRFWPKGDAVGSVLYADGGVRRRVVGVVNDAMYSALGEKPEPSLAIPLDQASFQPRLLLVVRTEGNPEPVMATVRREVHQLAPALPLTMVTMREHIRQAEGTVRGSAIITFLAGVLALIVALAGVYGVMAYAVSRRRHEYGVRMALGASGRDLAREVLADGLRTTGAGLAAGALLALAVARVVEGLLSGVRGLDPATFLAVVTCVGAAAMLAAYAPARRAARMQPADVLRVE
ncbi:MAG: ABC transporter permease [Gemmatimonadota bacterium]|jgi:predicted permease